MLKSPPTAPGVTLRALYAADTVLMPGVFNAISALSATASGAQALYLSGAGLTNGTLGVPDIALAGLSEFAQQARYITAVTPLPILCDVDTGFGGVHNVYRTILEMETAGVAGVHLEDQESPKRCGHLDGKSVVSVDEMCAKVRAAVDARRDASFIIISRTDARGVEGLDCAIERAKAYVDAGADGVFPEGLQSESEFAAFRDALDVPLLANMTEFGKTPIIPLTRFRELGYQMVIFPMTAFRMMLKALDDTYDELVQTGTQVGLLDRMRTRAELYQRLDYSLYDAQDRKWATEIGGG